MSVSDKTVTLPKWDGSEKTFQMWWVRFQAYAKIYKFNTAIRETAETELPDKDSDALDESTDQANIQAKRWN